MADPTEHERWIATVLARAQELRAAGVLSIGIDGRSASFSPAEPVPLAVGKIDAPDASASLGYLPPLDDPASYPDGVVPGFKIEKLELED